MSSVGALRPAAAHQRQDRVDHLLAHRHAADQRLGGHQLLGGQRRRRAFLGRAGGGEQHRALGLQHRVADVDLQQEPVELRLGQRVGAFLLDRVLRRQHVERPRQRVLHAGDGDALFLHRLQQRRLGARAGAVDLVGHQQLAEHRAGDEAEAAPPVGFVQHLGADDVGGHQVGGELHPLGGQAQHGAQRLDQPALAQAGHADQQRVAAGQQGDQRLVDHLILAEDHPADGGAHGAHPRAERLHVAEDRLRVEPRRTEAGCVESWAALLRRRHTERHAVRLPFFPANAVTYRQPGTFPYLGMLPISARRREARAMMETGM